MCSGTKPIRTLLAIRQRLMTNPIAQFLSNHHDIDVVAQASDEADAWSVLSNITAEVAVLDAMLLPTSRERVARSNLISMAVVVITTRCGKSPEITAPLRETLPRLAQVATCEDPESLVEAIRWVARGETRRDDGAKRQRGKRKCPVHSAPNAVTVNEARILWLIARGHSSRAISETLELNVRTVENHRYRLMQKLDARNVAQLMVSAVGEGLIDV